MVVMLMGVLCGSYPYLFFLIGGEDGDLFVCDVRPLDKLLSPLHNRHPSIKVSQSIRFPLKSAPEERSEHKKERKKTHDEVHKTRHDFLIVQAAVIPTRVLPAPQGNTMIPERARPFPNILLREVSWYGRITVDGLRSISRLALMVSFLKSYSSSMGYSSSLHRFLTS